MLSKKNFLIQKCYQKQKNNLKNFKWNIFLFINFLIDVKTAIIVKFYLHTQNVLKTTQMTKPTTNRVCMTSKTTNLSLQMRHIFVTNFGPKILQNDGHIKDVKKVGQKMYQEM